MSLIHQPMDKFFKKAMEEFKVAQEFFQAHLPTGLLEKIDLTILKLEKNSFIDEIFKAREADVLYSVVMKKTKAVLYILCEQQSKIDKDIAYRLLVYTVRIMEMHRKRFPNTQLPLVYPLVLYSGKKPWDMAKDIFPLFGEQENLAREFLFKPYQLVDLHRTSDEALKKHNHCGLIEFVLKYRKTQNFAQLLDTLFPWLQDVTQGQTGVPFRKIVLNYVADTIDISEQELFIQKANQYFSGQLRGEAMTFSQFYEKRGVEIGIQQGIEQGKQQGLLEGEKAVLLRLLQRKFGKVSLQYRNQIKKADSAIIMKLIDALFEAKTAEEIFE